MNPEPVAISPKQKFYEFIAIDPEQIFFVLSVASVGPHGEGFACGWVVVQAMGGRSLEEGILATDPDGVRGLEQAHAWARGNVDLDGVHFQPDAYQVRYLLWKQWTTWEEKGALVVAYNPWPVEAGFMTACVNDHVEERRELAPQAIHGLGTFCLASGIRSSLPMPKNPKGVPEFNPLADARHTARLLLDVLGTSGLVKGVQPLVNPSRVQSKKRARK